MNESSDNGAPPLNAATADGEPLAGAFPAATYAMWEELVRSKAKDPDRRLVTALEEGLEVSWLYSAGDTLAPDPGGLPGAAPFVRGIRTGAPWALRQRTAAAEPAVANAQILEELEGGATEILLAIDPTGVGGVAVSDVDALDAVLAGVYLDLAPIALEGDPHGADLLLELYRRRGLPAEELTGSLGLNPIGSAALALDAAVARVTPVRAEFPRLRVLAVDTTPFAEAGAGGVLELALALSAGVAYLRTADAAAIAPAELAAALEFTLAVGPDQFLEIARLRAARRLWAAVLEHCGVPAEQRSSPLYGRTSRRMYSSLDPWVNLLRATTAAFAAAVGGADGITVLPFDEPYGEGVTDAGPLGRRIARNTQLLLSEESSLHRVADPAGGSWYVESLTEQIAQAAWTEFQALEAAGGITALLASGELADRLANLTAERQRAIARRRRSLTGVNQFPLLGDDGLDRPSPSDDASASSTSPVPQTGDGVKSLGLVRDAAQFEALRARAGTIPDAKILLACTGPLAAHVNVAQWAKSFFEAGGVETIASGADPDLPALVAEHGVRAAAVCIGKDSDPAPAVAALRGAGVEILYAVGGEIDGIERVKDGVDMVAALSALLDRFEAEETES
jgi:methylmalonyl-CoA mutase